MDRDSTLLSKSIGREKDGFTDLSDGNVRERTYKGGRDLGVGLERERGGGSCVFWVELFVLAHVRNKDEYYSLYLRGRILSCCRSLVRSTV